MPALPQLVLQQLRRQRGKGSTSFVPPAISYSTPGSEERLSKHYYLDSTRSKSQRRLARGQPLTMRRAIAKRACSYRARERQALPRYEVGRTDRNDRRTHVQSSKSR